MSTMSEFDQRAVVALLEQEIDAQRAAVDAIQYHGLDSLLDGTPQTLSTIAALSGLLLNVIEGGVQALIEVGRIEVDGDRVIGIGGLTMTPNEHSLTLWRNDNPTTVGDDLDLDATVGLGHAMWGQYKHPPNGSG